MVGIKLESSTTNLEFCGSIASALYLFYYAFASRWRCAIWEVHLITIQGIDFIIAMINDADACVYKILRHLYGEY